LVDSPVGLAACFLEKFHSWSDGDGELSEKFDIDELLTNRQRRKRLSQASSLHARMKTARTHPK
jgi:hypothetical protein